MFKVYFTHSLCGVASYHASLNLAQEAVTEVSHR